MKWDAGIVKEPVGNAPPQRDRGGFRRHFAGYELGLVTVGMVLTFALLALPRASTPTALPVPKIDRAEARRSAEDERALAARTERERLPFEIRSVGEAIRRFGRAKARGEDAAAERDELNTRMLAASGAVQVPLLLRLRAVQTEYFLRALRQFARDGKASTDLDELGGDFVVSAQRNGWLDSRRHLLIDESTLRVLFHLRWVDLIGRRTVFPFAPSLNDWRMYYGFLLRHPQPSARPDDANDGAAARLRVVAALSRKDPEYPEAVARGFLLYQMGEVEGSAVAYRRYLGEHASGPYVLLARNQLIYVLRGLTSE
ncbi:MAG TPA: hypothetical protein VHV51_08305 [Polyangiaceae bacterium]|jgi:hypothetical protein|nr:hypothetical protein [Polyangiaceae bacterium]